MNEINEIKQCKTMHKETDRTQTREKKINLKSDHLDIRIWPSSLEES